MKHWKGFCMLITATLARRIVQTLLVAACLFCVAGSAFGQNGAPTTGSNFVSSTFSLGPMTVGSQNFTATSITVVYNSDLGAGQFVPASQIQSTAAGAFASYPSPTDPPEAIGVAVGQTVMSTFPQINGLSLSISQIIVPTGVPTGATVSENLWFVVLGTLSSNGNTAAQRAPARKLPVPAAAPAPTTTKSN
jgi:hypothetical protein